MPGSAPPTTGNRIPESYLRRFLPVAQERPGHDDTLPAGLAAFLGQLGPRQEDNRP